MKHQKYRILRTLKKTAELILLLGKIMSMKIRYFLGHTIIRIQSMHKT